MLCEARAWPGSGRPQLRSPRGAPATYLPHTSLREEETASVVGKCYLICFRVLRIQVIASVTGVFDDGIAHPQIIQLKAYDQHV